MRHFIVIGNPISHSKSPLIHQEFARQTHKNIRYQRQLCPEDFNSFAAVVEAFFNGGGIGANVTLPFKEWAFQLCQQQGVLSEYAQSAEAVNTLALKNGKLYGDNTDGRGLVTDLTQKNIALHKQTIAILGAGGATRGIMLPLINAGANIVIFNRTLDKAQQLVTQFAPFKSLGQTLRAHSLADLAGIYDLVINGTSAGTTNQLLNLHRYNIIAKTAYDMTYGKDTEFLRHFQKNKAVCYDGLGMLLHQAAFSFALWHDIDIATLDMQSLYSQLSNA